MQRPLDSLGARLRFARKQRDLSQEELAAAVSESQSTISKIENQTIQQTGAIARLADALNVHPMWLELGRGPEPDWTKPHHASAVLLKETVAQYLIHPEIEHAPHIDWGAKMTTDDLPDVFWLTMKDNAMAPRAGTGKRICFSRKLQARAGDGVLVRDRTGELYFREMRLATADRWTAHASNNIFAPLDSVADGLQIVAVLMAEEGRWS